VFSKINDKKEVLEMVFPDISINQIRSVLFIESIDGNFNKVKIAANILDNIHLFEDEQAILPIPDDAPAEIPRIILKGKEYECQISLKQIVFLTNSSTDTLSLKKIEELIEEFKKLIAVIIETTNMRFSRFGFVVKGSLTIEPFSFIKEYYLKDKILTCNGYEFGFLTNLELAERNFNKWVKYKNQENKVDFIIDYNTLSNINDEIPLQLLSLILDNINNEFTSDYNKLFETEVIIGNN